MEAARRDKDEMAAAIQDASGDLEQSRDDVQAERMKAKELAQLERGRQEMLALLEQEKVTLSLAVAERQAEL